MESRPLMSEHIQQHIEQHDDYQDHKYEHAIVDDDDERKAIMDDIHKLLGPNWDKPTLPKETK
jgi:hypothetical protein